MPLRASVWGLWPHFGLWKSLTSFDYLDEAKSTEKIQFIWLTMVYVCVCLIWRRIYKADFILKIKSEFLDFLEKLRNLVTLGSYSSMATILQTWEKLTLQRLTCAFQVCTALPLSFTNAIIGLAFLSIWVKSLPTGSALPILLLHSRLSTWVAHLCFSV